MPSTPPRSPGLLASTDACFTTSVNRLSRIGISPAVGVGQSGNGLLRNVLGLLRNRFSASGSWPSARPNPSSTLRACRASKSSTAAALPSLHERHIQRLQESRQRPSRSRRGPRSSGCDAPAVALSQCLHQLGVRLVGVGLEPLLELVEHDEELRRRRRLVSSRRIATASGRAMSAGSAGTSRRSSASSRASVPPGVASMYDRPDSAAVEAWQQPRPDKRRLAAAGGAVEHADAEDFLAVGRLDPVLPEPD